MRLLPDLQVDGTRLNKAQADAQATAIASIALVDGHSNPLEIYIALTYLEEVVYRAKEMLKNSSIDEAAKFNGQTMFGVKVESTNAAARWKYDHDPEWARLKAELAAREKLLKQAAETTATMVDEATGEEIPKALKELGATTLRITIPK